MKHRPPRRCLQSPLERPPDGRGERYNSKALTAAHQTLPFGTKVKVTYLKTNKSVIVRINDRGPKQAGRILDLSSHAADSLGIHHGRHGGLVEVKLEVVKAAKK